MKYERQDHLIKILLKYFKGISPIAIIDLVETLWPGRSQSDWNETNINSPTYIIGKPDLSDEKVGFVTPEFEIANTPGYLSTDYFEAETDLVTGRTIITPKILTPYGGIVTLRTGLIFDISKGGRVINGKFYEAEADSITLTAHATLDKVVVFYMDNTGSYGVLESTPGVLLKPSIDPLTQVELTSVTIPAATTTIPNVNEVVIYNEHTGAEWTPSIEGTTADFDSTVAPSTGSICAAIGELSNGDRIVFTDDVDYTDTDWSTLIMDIQLPNSNSFGNFIEAYFEKDGKPRSSLVYATYNRFNTNWQTVVFVISDFAVRNALFNGFVLRWFNRSGATYAGIKIDNVRLQKGIDLPVSEDSYSTGVSFDTVTRILTIERNNGLPAMSANIPIGYNWNLHSPEQIMGYVGTPVGLNIAVNGSGSVDYTVPIDTLAVTALNAQGETTPAYNSAFDILTDTTDALITWIEDANATGYRIYKKISSVWYYFDTATDNIDYLELVPGIMTAGDPPTANTAAIYQTAFTIDNGDTVQLTGEGIDIATSVDPLDSKKKRIHLTVNPGLDGRGIVSVVLTGTVGLVDTYTITYTDATTSTFDVTNGEDGAPGAPGSPGTSSYTYVAYASDNAGTGWSLTPTDLLKYRAEIHRTSPLSPPVAGDFTGATWVKYLGDDGAGGTGSEAPELHLDFGESGLAYTYNVPYAMKFTSMVCEGTDATLSVALNTNLARYDKLTITATAAGLVSLYGEYV